LSILQTKIEGTKKIAENATNLVPIIQFIKNSILLALLPSQKRTSADIKK